MAYLSRRTALTGASVALLGAALSPGAAFASAELEAQGCFLRDDQQEVVGKKLLGSVFGSANLGDLITSSGNPTFDRYLGRALLRLSDTFNVYPGFSFVDDGRHPNAFADPATLIPGTRGTVLFGRSLFQECMTRASDDGLTVITICAHEFGHMVQRETGYHSWLLRGQKTKKLVELHADHLAGFFLATRKREHPNLMVQGVGRTFEELGDTDYMLREHHGTPDERVAAIQGGYFFGKSAATTIAQAAEAGAQFVRRFS